MWLHSYYILIALTSSSQTMAANLDLQARIGASKHKCWKWLGDFLIGEKKQTKTKANKQHHKQTKQNHKHTQPKLSKPLQNTD